MPTITELTWASMTAAINEMDSPNRFLTRLLYGDRRPQTTETIDIDLWIRGRKMAPFITKGANAVPIDGPTIARRKVEAPTIRIKRELDPSEMLFGRTPGSAIFPTRAAQTAAIRDHIAKELQPLADDITNTVEWMCAQTLRGSLTYTNDKYESFTMNFQRPAGHDIDLSTSTTTDWAGTNTDILGDLHNVKRVMHLEGFQPTDCIMSESASDALQNSIASDTSLRAVLDNRQITAGAPTFENQFDEDGVIFFGRIAGIRFWEYGRTVNNDGSDEALIRDKYVEFVSRTPAADFVLYFGAIPDMEAFEGRAWVGERFAKSKMNFDPPTSTFLVHSRPLPVPRRPGATLSMKVIAQS